MVHIFSPLKLYVESACSRGCREASGFNWAFAFSDLLAPDSQKPQGSMGGKNEGYDSSSSKSLRQESESLDLSFSTLFDLGGPYRINADNKIGSVSIEEEKKRSFSKIQTGKDEGSSSAQELKLALLPPEDDCCTAQTEVPSPKSSEEAWIFSVLEPYEDIISSASNEVVKPTIEAVEPNMAPNEDAVPKIASNEDGRIPSLVLVGCPRCYLYVMVSEAKLQCPQCKSTELIDEFRGNNAKKVKIEHD